MKAIGNLKVCSTCRKELPLDAFYRQISANDGLTTYCKVCFDKRPSHKRAAIKNNAKHYRQGRLPKWMLD